MEQKRINSLIEYDWSINGLEDASQEVITLWKEFAEFISIDAKSQQIANTFFNLVKQANSIDKFNEAYKNISLDELLQDCIIDQYSIIINRIANPFLDSTNIKGNFKKVQVFFNFIWYCLYPVIFCKVFINLLKMKDNTYYDEIIDRLSKIVYGYDVTLNNISLKKKNNCSKTLFIVMGNLIDSLNEITR